MKYWVLFLISISLFANDYSAVLISGHSKNRCDLVFLQHANEHENFSEKMLDMWNQACDYYPLFKRYKNFFNIHAINRNDLDINEWWNRSHMLKDHFDKVDQSFSKRDLGLLVRNLDYIKGAAVQRQGKEGRIGYISNANFQVFIHEMGHMIASLSDLYENHHNYTGYYPENIILPDDNLIFEGHDHLDPKPKKGFNKWSRWYGYVDPITSIVIDGPYMHHKEPYKDERALHYISNFWAPTSHATIMKNNAAYFDAVSREEMIIRLYDFCEPIDSCSENNLTINDNDVLEVNVIDDNVIDVLWLVNDEPVSNDNYLDISALNLKSDANITLVAWDSTLNTDYESEDRGGWVRRDIDNRLVQEIIYKYKVGDSNKKWDDLIPIAVSNWKKSFWFGNFAAFSNNWIYHEKLKWAYVYQANIGMWLFLEDHGWAWTTRGIYPYIYESINQEWLYIN
jgi:hypothetical protein